MLAMAWPSQLRRGVAQCLRQLLAQLQAGAEQAHLHVGLAQVKRFGGFPDGKSFHVPQQKNKPVFFVQSGQGFIQQTLNLTPLD